MAERAGREERRHQTVTKLLDAATQVFVRKGIERASLDEVAAAAGLTKGAVYSNFASKEELVLALFWRHVGSPETDPLAAAAAGERPSAYHRVGDDYARALGTEAVRDWAVMIIEFWSYAMRNPSARELMVSALETVREMARREVPADADGTFSPDERATLSVALNVGMAIQHLIDPDRVPADLYGKALRLIHEGRDPDHPGDDQPRPSCASG